MPSLVFLFAKRFGTRQRSFIGPGSEKKWYCISEDSPQGEWDNMAEKMMLEFTEKWTSTQKQKQRSWENCRYTIVPIWKRLRLFRIIVSVDQLSLYAAVAGNV